MAFHSQRRSTSRWQRDLEQGKLPEDLPPALRRALQRRLRSGRDLDVVAIGGPRSSPSSRVQIMARVRAQAQQQAGTGASIRDPHLAHIRTQARSPQVTGGQAQARVRIPAQLDEPVNPLIMGLGRLLPLTPHRAVAWLWISALAVNAERWL